MFRLVRRRQGAGSLCRAFGERGGEDISLTGAHQKQRMSNVARGFIRGVLWGAGISFGAVTLISIAGDGPKRTDWQRNSNAQIAPADEGPRDAIGSSGNRIALTGAETPIGSAPSPDTLVDVAAAAFDTAQIPETGLASDLPQAGLPDTSSQNGMASTDTSAPQVRITALPALTTPATEPDISISTLPAQPLAPDANQQQTAFAEPDDSALPEPDTAGAAPATAPVVVDSVAEPLQPSVSDVEENTGSPSQTAEVESGDPQDPSTDLSPDVQFDVAGLDAPEASDNTAHAGDEMAASVDETPEEQASVPIAVSDVPQIELLQPQATTELEVAMAEPVSAPAARLPQIATEAEAPSVAEASDLDEPTASDTKQSAGESASASVAAAVVLDADVEAPATATAVASRPAEPEESAPDTVDVPEIVLVTAPDPVATADLTLAEPATAVATASVSASQAEVPTAQTFREVKVNRLPSLGLSTSPETQGVEPENATVDGSDVDLPTSGLTPVMRYAEPFENPENKPVMAIVLIDEGTALSGAAIGLPALRQLPYPVSFAVDTSLPDAPERMKAYRNEGFEVLAMVDLPKGATATDAEVNLSVALERMPEVVGVMEGLNTGVQTTRDSGRQVAQILSRSGHGFVTQNKGLNTVQKLAARQGVPSGVVFRDFDAQGQSARVIGRFLDQAAFRARQEGGVIMLGRMREETIAALLVWALQDRASQVALAPVSGALRTQEP